MEQSQKMTSLEKRWVLYDVGNSAFTLLISTILPIYFNGLAGAAGLSDAEYLAFWGYAASFVTVVVAVLGPTLGAVADLPGMKEALCAVRGGGRRRLRGDGPAPVLGVVSGLFRHRQDRLQRQSGLL